MHARLGLEDALCLDEVGIETGRFGEFVLKSAYQPIFRREGSVLAPFGMEGLIRPFKDGEPVSPAQFFAAVPPERRFYVESLCRALHLRNRRNLDGIGPGLRLFFNFDPLTNGDFDRVEWQLGRMMKRLPDFGVDTSLLVCEITETEALSERTLSALVARIRALGMGIAVDDFGAGHSTVRRIELIAPDIVKIDGCWFRRVAAVPAARALLAPLFRGFADMGSEVLVEGIETPAQLDVALRAGANHVQGHLLGRPALVGSALDLDIRHLGEPSANLMERAEQIIGAAPASAG